MPADKRKQAFSVHKKTKIGGGKSVCILLHIEV